MKDNKMSFEQSAKRLEEIVQLLENGTSDLENSLQLFSEGVDLVKYCNSVLDNAEQKVRILVDDGHGQMMEKDLED